MSRSESTYTLQLTHKELVALLVLFRKCEFQLDDVQQQISERVAMELYDQLSIEEMQRAEEYYAGL